MSLCLYCVFRLLPASQATWSCLGSVCLRVGCLGQRDPVRAGKRPEIVVEGVVLLDDDDDVLDRVCHVGSSRGLGLGQTQALALLDHSSCTV